MEVIIFIILFAFVFWLENEFKNWRFKSRRKKRKDYYRNVYLKSDAWKRKRYVVLKRDNWKCVYCGKKAEQVHHKRYLRRKIGKVPIKWLESVCAKCHESLH